MTTPLYCLLGFAAWTLLLAVSAILTHRVPEVLRGRAASNDFPADTPHGPGWYRRLLRAHANCVENLPVFAAVVLVAAVAGVTDATMDRLAQAYLAARVLQSLSHVASGSAFAVNARFTFFVAQIICVGWMIVHLTCGACGA